MGEVLFYYPSGGHALMNDNQNAPATNPPRVDTPWAMFFGSLTPLVVTRFAFIVAGLVAIRQMPTLPNSQLTPYPWINIWNHWDSGWYLNIAGQGYQYTPGEECNVAFFPLYPYLMRWIGQCFGGGDWAMALGGVIVSNISLVVAAMGLWALARLDLAKEGADRALWYLMVFPTTLFLSAVYSMSITLAIIVVLYYFARRGMWAIAGLVAALNGLARPDGFVLAIGLAAEYLEQRQWRLGEVRWNVLWLALTPLATAAWLAVQWVWFGTPLAFVHAQYGWPIASIFNSFGGIGSFQRLCYLIPVTGLVVFAGLRLRKGYAIYGLAQLAIWVVSARMDAVPRFALVLFPVFLAMALVTERRAWLHNTIMVGAMSLAMFNMVRFALGYMVR